jgi:hypothetical protein
MKHYIKIYLCFFAALFSVWFFGSLLVALTTNSIGANSFNLFSFLYKEEKTSEEQISSYDTSALDQTNTNTIRIIKGWVIDNETIEDENGNLWNWEFEGTPPTKNTNVLIWLDNNGTQDDITDDIITNLWKEVY